MQSTMQGYRQHNNLIDHEIRFVSMQWFKTTVMRVKEFVQIYMAKKVKNSI